MCENMFAFSVEGIFVRAENQASQVSKKKSQTCSLTLYSSSLLFSTVGKTIFFICHITTQMLHFVPIQYHWIQAALEDYSGGMNLHTYLHWIKRKTIGREYPETGRHIFKRQKEPLYILQIKAFLQYIFIQTSLPKKTNGKKKKGGEWT